MTDNQQRADELLRGRPSEFHVRVAEIAAALDAAEARGRAEARELFERIREAHREMGQRDEYPHLH